MKAHEGDFRFIALAVETICDTASICQRSRGSIRTLDHVGPHGEIRCGCSSHATTIAGFDERDPTCADVPVNDYLSGLNGNVKGLKIGINEEYFFKDVDGPVEKIIRERIADLEKQGATVTTVSIPSLRNAEWVELATSLSEASAIDHGKKSMF